MNTIATLTQQLIHGHSMSRESAYTLLPLLETTPLTQQAAILALLAAKLPSAHEILGLRDYLFSHSITIDSPIDCMDIVGTGGDGKGTFNISTATSIVVASCGVTVAKHGGRSATSQCGSTDVIAALGIAMSETPSSVIRDLTRDGYAYLRAPDFNPLLARFREVRKSVSFPTLLNILGPLINPLQPKRMLLGVYSKALMRPIAQVLKDCGCIRAMVVHSEDGLDELSISAPTHVAELKAGSIHEYAINPQYAGLPIAPLQSVLGGSPYDNAQLISALLTGQHKGPALDILLLNAATALVVADKATDLATGAAIAREAIESGITAQFFHTLQQRN